MDVSTKSKSYCRCSKNDIYLLMIVKNESHVIADTLRNVTGKVPLSGVLVCDTGSTDDTVSVITDSTRALNLDGSVVNHEWKHFGHNRSLALEEARNRLPEKNDDGYDSYVLMFDADDSITGELAEELPSVMTADAYTLSFRTPTFSYNRPLLIRLSSQWKYEGVLHEFLSDQSPNKTNRVTHIEGDYTITSGRTGDRSRNPEKYCDDAQCLEKAISDDSTPSWLLPRYAFYCAQSWKDGGNIPKAIDWYKSVITKYDNWSEEKYYASLKLGELLRGLGRVEEAIYYFLMASSHNQKRLEAITEAAKLLLDKQHYHPAHSLLLPYADRIIDTADVDNSWLFSVPLTYSYDALLRLALSSYYADDSATLKKVVLEFLRRVAHLETKRSTSDIQSVSEHIQSFMVGLEFYLVKLVMTDYDELRTLFTLVKQALMTCMTITTLYTCHQWRSKFDMAFTDLVRRTGVVSGNAVIRNDGTNGEREGDVLLTMTTCRRVGLFKKTVHSMLECFSEDDISRITDWLVIDDGSTEEELDEMRREFPFIRIVTKAEANIEMRTEVRTEVRTEMMTEMRTEVRGGVITRGYEKGHRDSMNYIYDTLVALQPAYWLHVEDDWMFLEKDVTHGFIGKAIRFLENPACMREGISQVLFNKGYGETVGDVIVPCGETVCDDEGERECGVVDVDVDADADADVDVKVHLRMEGSTTELCMPNCNYWNHFSLRPGVSRVSSILDVGDFNTPNPFFEADYADKFVDKGYKTAYFNDITCLHLGRLSGKRGTQTDTDALSSYVLNDTNQF